jgi:hypothetical protein
VDDKIEVLVADLALKFQAEANKRGLRVTADAAVIAASNVAVADAIAVSGRAKK